LDRSYIKVISQASLRSPILVAGFPGAGNVGVASAKLLAEFLDAKLLAELYSPTLLDYTTVDPDGICSLLKYDFFVSAERDLLILIGDSQPPLEDILAYYELCGDILDFICKFNCNLIVTVDGFPLAYPQSPQRAIYVAGTSGDVASECTFMGAEIYPGRRIIGLSGLLLGLAKLRGIKGLCILSPVMDLVSDEEASSNAYRFLRRMLKLGLEKTID